MEQIGGLWLKMDKTVATGASVRVFRGTYEHSITRQGRIVLPARFREVLEERQCTTVVLVRFNNRLDVFPEDEWQAREEELRLLDQNDKRVFAYVQYIEANQIEADVDAQGRILVPPRCRSSLGLDGNVEVVMKGAHSHFQIWPQPRFAEASRQWEEDFEENMAYVAELNRSLRNQK